MTESSTTAKITSANFCTLKVVNSIAKQTNHTIRFGEIVIPHIENTA